MLIPFRWKIYTIVKGTLMKSITAFIGSLGGGGAQGVFVTVMNYYVHLGYEVNAVVDDLANDVYSSKLDKRIIITELGAKTSKQSLPKTYKYLSRNDIEIAFAFSPEIAVNLVICKKLLNRSFIIIARCINTLSYEYKYAEEPFRRFVTAKLVRLLYKKVDHVIAQAENMKEDLIHNYGFKPNQVTTINNPLAIKYENIEISCRDRGNYILYVGRLEKQKGLDMLLDAFSKIDRKDIELYLIGNGSKKQELIQQSKGLSIDKRVRFIDYKRNIEEYYVNSICTVLTSIFEGFPNVLVESIACGTPVVSFDLPSGPRDIIIPGVNGYLAKYKDVDDLTNCLNEAIKEEWDYKKIQLTAQRFQKENILPQYNDVIENYK